LNHEQRLISVRLSSLERAMVQTYETHGKGIDTVSVGLMYCLGLCSNIAYKLALLQDSSNVQKNQRFVRAVIDTVCAFPTPRDDQLVELSAKLLMDMVEEMHEMPSVWTTTCRSAFRLESIVKAIQLVSSRVFKRPQSVWKSQVDTTSVEEREFTT